MFIVGSWNDVIDCLRIYRRHLLNILKESLLYQRVSEFIPIVFLYQGLLQKLVNLEDLAKHKDSSKNKVTLFRGGKFDESGKQIEVTGFLSGINYHI